MLMLTLMQTMEQEQVRDRDALERLLLEVAAGEQEALAQLYHRTRTAVYGLVLSYVKNAHDAQDITQDTFVRIWDNAPQYRPQGSPMGWMLTIARNLAPNLSTEDRLLVQNALAALEEQERRVVVLHAVTGLKHREIAALLELPLATVLSKYHRALKKLKLQLEGDGIR